MREGGIGGLMRRYPTLTALGLYALAIALVFWPVWTGQTFLNPFSDQNTGYPFRLFAADYLKAHFAFPQWSPYLFGGMPYIAAQHGDIFYPTFLLRLFLPPDVGITIGMMVHMVLAGTFTHRFLRSLGLSWGAAFAGGAAYMLSGQLVSLVTPGHDGKLIVSALLPLALLFLHRAVTQGSWRSYLAFGVVVGFSLLSPHFQLTYYLLMASGFFWLFLVAASRERPAAHAWWHAALLFGGAVVLGFAVDAIQMIPFREYIAFSPRGAEGSSSSGWAYATSWSMPPEELLNVVWPSFSGMVENYWGRNPFKLHSEYLGVVPLMLASLGFALPERRRYAWFFTFLAGYAVLFALGGHTPFYRLPYHLLPGIKMTRAPSMIFFMAAFSTAVLAGFGVQALLAGQARARRILYWWLGALAIAAMLAGVGAWREVMLAVADPSRAAAVAPNYGNFTWDAVRAVLMGGILVALTLWAARGRVPAEAWGLVVGMLVLVDLWSVERRQFRYSPPGDVLFAPDGVVDVLARDTTVFRVLPVNVYMQDNYLMTHRVRAVIGYHGQELHRYDELLGGKNEWRNLGNPNLWRLLAVKYLVVDRPVEIPELEPLGSGALRTYEGREAYLYRLTDAAPFAEIVPEALKVPDDQIVPTLLDPRFDPRSVLLVPPEGPVGLGSLSALPEPLDAPVRTVEERPGRYRFTIDEPAAADAYLFVSENFYPGWRARVDGREAPVVRAQLTFLAVPLPAGARTVELEYDSSSYHLGRAITLITLLALLGVAGHGWWMRRRTVEGHGV